MSCSPFDLKDYLFGELAAADCARLEEHVENCRPCREELDRLRLTEAALHALREEEPPRRIAFVSDKVFEPRWWQKLWQPTPGLAFAGAAMLSLAILVHAFVRPGAAPAPVASAQAVQERVDTEVARRVDAAVRTAVAQSEERQAKRTAELVESVRHDLDFQRRADRVAFEEAFTVLQKKYNVMVVASSELGGRP
jgi:anti-sigma factor RsiW